MPQAHRPFQSGVNASHLLLLGVILLIRNGFGEVTTTEAGAEHQPPLAHGGEEGEHHGAGGEHHGGHDEHGYEVFHVDFQYVQVPFIISLWIFVSSLAKIGFHMTPLLHNIFPESCLLIVVGIVIGFLLILTSEKVPTTLTPNIFFLFMLPPIIFDAGYFMPNRLFFDHLGTILLMAVMGTIFNMLTVGSALYACGLTGIYGEDYPGILETFLFASLIVAVDPVAVLAVFEEIHVDEILYIVVFGESLLNDAVTVVLYHMFEAYVEIGEAGLQYTDLLKGLASFLVVACGGTIIGIVWGFLTGFVTRFTHHARVLEPLFVFVMAYMSYLNAELFHMSGILAITFCGITMKNYVERNISSKSQTTLRYALKMLSGSSETIIFMFLGVATIHDDHEWNWGFVCLTILFCTVFRVLGVLLLIGMANRYRLHKLGAVDQFVMMYGGLRGAVAFALVLLIDKKAVPHAPMFVTTTIAMIYWTVFVQGITIKPLVRYLNVKTSSEKEPTMNERIAGRFMDHVVAGMEGILGEFGNLRLRDMYKYFDTKYIKPCLLRENHYKDPKIIETYENLTNKDAVEFMKRNPTQFAGLKSMQEMAEMSNSASTIFRNNTFLNGSQANLENLDMKEMVYTPSQKDLTETKIHHMLSENLFMPRARPRRMSYSRHAMKEEDLAMNHDVNYRVHMHVRRMMSESKARRRKQAKRINQVQKANNHYDNNGYVDTEGDYNNKKSRVTFESEGSRVAGSSKMLKDDMIHEVCKDDNDSDDEGGLTFSLGNKDSEEGRKSPKSPKGQRRYLNPASPGRQRAATSKIQEQEDKKKVVSSPSYPMRELYDRRKPSVLPEGAHEPTAIERTLPWKRDDKRDIMCEAPVKQKEFPAWIKNESYMVHGTPASAILEPAGDIEPTTAEHSADVARRASIETADTIDEFNRNRRHSEAEFQAPPNFGHIHHRRGTRHQSISQSGNSEALVEEDQDEVSKL